MGNKKIWAYGKSKLTNEYINDQNHVKRMFFIWEALKLKNKNPEYFENIIFLSTHSHENDRQQMSAVKTGFFRYLKNNIGNSYSGDGESLSHSIAILALSQLETLNFTIGEKIIKIVPEKISIDDLKVQFPNGNYYYPDLICTYKNPSSLLEKWGNKIAIEVKVSHSCEPIKIKDFQDSNYPIIEITLKENMQFLKERKKEEFNETDLENYYNFLVEKFSKNIYGKVISNPIKIDFHRKIVNELNNKIIEKESDILNLKNSTDQIIKHNEQNIKSLNFDVNMLKKEIEFLKESNKNIIAENDKLKNKSFLNKLKELFQ